MLEETWVMELKRRGNNSKHFYMILTLSIVSKMRMLSKMGVRIDRNVGGVGEFVVVHVQLQQ